MVFENFSPNMKMNQLDNSSLHPENFRAPRSPSKVKHRNFVPTALSLLVDAMPPAQLESSKDTRTEDTYSTEAQYSPPEISENHRAIEKYNHINSLQRTDDGSVNLLCSCTTEKTLCSCIVSGTKNTSNVKIKNGLNTHLCPFNDIQLYEDFKETCDKAAEQSILTDVENFYQLETTQNNKIKKIHKDIVDDINESYPQEIKNDVYEEHLANATVTEQYPPNAIKINVSNNIKCKNNNSVNNVLDDTNIKRHSDSSVNEHLISESLDFILEGCSLKSNEIPCLMGEKPPLMSSDDNTKSDIDACTFMIYNNPSYNYNWSCKDSRNLLQFPNDIYLGSHLPCKVDEKTMSSWMEMSSDDSDICDDDDKETEMLLRQLDAAFESEMEEFEETVDNINLDYKKLESSDSDEPNERQEKTLENNESFCENLSIAGKLKNSESSNHNNEIQLSNIETPSQCDNEAGNVVLRDNEAENVICLDSINGIHKNKTENTVDALVLNEADKQNGIQNIYQKYDISDILKHILSAEVENNFTVDAYRKNSSEAIPVEQTFGGYNNITFSNLLRGNSYGDNRKYEPGLISSSIKEVYNVAVFEKRSKHETHDSENLGMQNIKHNEKNDTKDIDPNEFELSHKVSTAYSKINDDSKLILIGTGRSTKLPVTNNETEINVSEKNTEKNNETATNDEKRDDMKSIPTKSYQDNEIIVTNNINENCLVNPAELNDTYKDSMINKVIDVNDIEIKESIVTSFTNNYKILPTQLTITEKEENRHSMEPTAALLQKATEEDVQPDLATALRFMTEVYHTKEDDTLYSDTLSISDLSSEDYPKGNQGNKVTIPDDFKTRQTDNVILNISTFNKPCESATFEPTLTDIHRAVIRPRSKFSKFFKSFKLKFTKKT